MDEVIHGRSSDHPLDRFGWRIILIPKNLPPSWERLLEEEWNKPYYQDLGRFLEREIASGKTIYPDRDHVFRAIEELDLTQVRVVILGQDPYHGPEQAIGRAFAVPHSLRVKPPSLRNILKEVEADLGKPLNPPQASDLSGWSVQGVLLLNTLLTVESGRPLSHQNQGWESFTDRLLELLNERTKPVLFLLWGSHARKKREKLDLKLHRVLEAPHPSPLSAHRGFFGSRIFSSANRILTEEFGGRPIDWTRVSAD